MPANSLLGGVPATVVCGNQMQVPSCKCPSQGRLVLLVPQGWTDHMCCCNLEVWIPAAGSRRLNYILCLAVQVDFHLESGGTLLTAVKDAIADTDSKSSVLMLYIYQCIGYATTVIHTGLIHICGLVARPKCCGAALMLRLASRYMLSSCAIHAMLRSFICSAARSLVGNSWQSFCGNLLKTFHVSVCKGKMHGKHCI